MFYLTTVRKKYIVWHKLVNYINDITFGENFHQTLASPALTTATGGSSAG
jgi:hypothetical protein